MIKKVISAVVVIATTALLANYDENNVMILNSVDGVMLRPTRNLT